MSDFLKIGDAYVHRDAISSVVPRDRGRVAAGEGLAPATLVVTYGHDCSTQAECASYEEACALAESIMAQMREVRAEVRP